MFNNVSGKSTPFMGGIKANKVIYKNLYSL